MHEKRTGRTSLALLALLVPLAALAAIRSPDPSLRVADSVPDLAQVPPGRIPNTWAPISAAGGPQLVGTRPTILWTGSEMLVWGWSAADRIQTTGALYNPATDTWRPMSQAGAPGSRSVHSAVWTGTEMIVWGGQILITPRTAQTVSDGARYDPASDTWAPIAIPNLAPRESATAIWTGREMIVWSGIGRTAGSESNVYFDDGAAYDPVADTWRPLSAATVLSPRTRARAFWTGSRMLVWGGSSRQGKHVDGALYDPVEGVWTSITPLSDVLSGCIGGSFSDYDRPAVWSGRELLVWGCGRQGNPGTGARYDPVTGSWQRMTTEGAPLGRANPTLVWTGTEMIVWAGGVPAGKDWREVTDGGRYNPDTDSWSRLSTEGLPAGSTGGFSAWTGQELVIWTLHSARTPATGARFLPG
jgi:hypothetical protein